MADEPDDLSFDRYRKAWARYERADRQRVVRAVNRMQPLDDPAEAALGIVFARRQQRMWMRWGWVYPLIPAAFAWNRGWEAVLANLAVGVVLMLLIAGLFVWRAKRSERIQREVIEAASRRRRSGSPKTRAKGTGGSASKKRSGRRRG